MDVRDGSNAVGGKTSTSETSALGSRIDQLDKAIIQVAAAVRAECRVSAALDHHLDMLLLSSQALRVAAVLGQPASVLKDCFHSLTTATRQTFQGARHAGRAEREVVQLLQALSIQAGRMEREFAAYLESAASNNGTPEDGAG